jgi:acyl-CoA dehydrogenase
LFGLTGGALVHAPTDNPTRDYYKQLTRYSASFAFAADVAMLVLGGGLKRREKLSARLGDVLSLLYLSSAVLKRFEDDGRPAEDEPLLHWAIQDNLFRIQAALDGVLQNFPNRFAAMVLRALIFPIGKCRRPPSDKLGHQVASLLLLPSATRDRLTAGMYLPTDEQDAVGALEAALASTLLCEPLQAEVEKARKAGSIRSRDEKEQIAEARELGILTAEQVLLLERDYALRRKVIMVDDFDPAQLPAGK